MQVNYALATLLDQVCYVLDQLEPEEYTRPLPEYDGSTIGQHFRHILEFFQCLENGIPTGVVDYAARPRDLRYECAPADAVAAFREAIEKLPALNMEQALRVKAELGAEQRPDYLSSLGRELLFVYDHAIHHLAIIKIGLRCQFAHIRTDKNLGVSPSTVKARLLMTND